jgi:aspartyl-tRNA(Asn)/glutamyl-tRNA(Gln) amidotransferase subunit C
MKIDNELLDKIAKLSLLKVKEEERDKLLHSLSSVFDYIEQLGEVDTSSIEAMSHVLPSLLNVVREDVVEESLTAQHVIKAAPLASGRYIKVPIIVEPGTEH